MSRYYTNGNYGNQTEYEDVPVIDFEIDISKYIEKYKPYKFELSVRWWSNEKNYDPHISSVKTKTYMIWKGADNIDLSFSKASFSIHYYYVLNNGYIKDLTVNGETKRVKRLYEKFLANSLTIEIESADGNLYAKKVVTF